MEKRTLLVTMVTVVNSSITNDPTFPFHFMLCTMNSEGPIAYVSTGGGGSTTVGTGRLPR